MPSGIPSSVASKTTTAWGSWIQSRAEFLGFKRQDDVAKLIGCSRQQLSNWYSLLIPPAQMRKGFDGTLASTLQTSKKVLFQDYASVAPESSPVLIFSPDHFFGSSRNDRLHSMPVDVMLAKIVGQMSIAELERMTEYGMQLILSKNDSRREDVEQIASHFGSVKAQAGKFTHRQIHNMVHAVTKDKR